MHLVTRSIKHEVTTPLRCLCVIAEDGAEATPDQRHTFETISNTAKLCLSFVEGQMDQLFLEND